MTMPRWFRSPAQTAVRIASAVLCVTGATSTVAASPEKRISQFTHTSWSARDGIPGPVRAIAQTADGYLWLGTEAGLYRFDGLRFVEWMSNSGDRLPSASIWSLCASRDGSLWIGSGSGGISWLHEGQLKNFTPADGIPSGGVLSIVEDTRGSIWAGGQYGFSKLDQGAWRHVGQESGYAARGAQALFVDRGGTLWVATEGVNFGLSQDPVLRNTVLSLPPNGSRFRATGQSVGMVWSMTQGPDGRVWIADTSGHTVRPLDAPKNLRSSVSVDSEPLCLIFDNDEHLWIGLIEDGLRRAADINRDKTSVRPLDRFGAIEGLSGGLVYSTFRDREGNLWFGTAGGLDRFRNNKVVAFSAAEGLDPDQQIALTSASRSGVWIVSYTRDAVRLLRDGRFDTLKLPRYSTTDTTRILSFFAEPSGRLWVGGNFGLAQYHAGRMSFLYASDIEKGSNVEGITVDPQGALWLGVTLWNPHASTETASKILRLDRGTWTDFGSKHVFPNYRSRVLHTDRLGRVWFGFENGEVAVYDNGEVHRYSSAEGLPGGRVLTIQTDRRGDVWVGSEGGLSRFNDDRFATIGREHGLPGTSVSGIVEDRDGLMWFACALGILRVSHDELDKAFSSPGYQLQGFMIGPSDGLRGLPRQREPFPTATLASDGRVWVATTNGAVVLDPQLLPTNPITPPVVIETIKADDHVLAISSNVQLSPSTRNLEISYAGLSLTDPARVQFRYKLDGYDKVWHGPTTARQATYTNLPPRQYAFRVVAANNDGVWNVDGASLAFVMLPTFYQTGWFRASAVLLVAAVCWVAYCQRIRYVSHQLNVRFDERLAERTRIAQELHDTLLQGCVSASMQLYVASERLPDDSTARSALTQALALMGRVVEEGRNAVRGLRSSIAAGHDLEEAFSAVATGLIVDARPDYRVIVEGRARPLNPLVRDDVYRIGREALLNAFRHSGADRIELELEYASSQLRVLVRDNGHGIKPDVLKSGSDGHWGLSGMRERAERIGARLRMWSGPSAGSEIELLVPGQIAFGGNGRWRLPLPVRS
jgi:ligand-binding sensor domain-containing protein